MRSIREVVNRGLVRAVAMPRGDRRAAQHTIERALGTRPSKEPRAARREIAV